MTRFANRLPLHVLVIVLVVIIVLVEVVIRIDFRLAVVAEAVAKIKTLDAAPEQTAAGAIAILEGVLRTEVRWVLIVIVEDAINGLFAATEFVAEWFDLALARP